MPEDKTISVAIVTRNRLKTLTQTLEHFFRNTTVPYELFIIDNGSTDGTVDFLKKEIEGKPDVNIILNHKDLGYGYAANQGWYRAKIKNYLVKIDDSILLPPKWAEGLIEICDNIKEVGCVGINFENVPFPYSELEVNGCFVQKKESPLKSRCFMVPRRAFEKVGYWNEKLVVKEQVDEDMGWRIKFAGFWNVYHPDLHQRVKNLDDDPDQENVEIENFAKKTNLRVFKKFYNYYREISELYKKPVSIYLDHIEKI